ncbi:SOS response-associated peptidase [Sphingomonas sp. URHD0057]|uniref:SOS response-associated peptidase n=1 Tax=Sphingomonas sp. URHD0057 TaxID=1380389 RepID=UPI00048B874C|nr:SOS response-associated peptidase [Sphingomonas sp. URHD0057]
MCNLYTQSKSVDEVARLFRDLQMPLSFPDDVPNLEPREIAITDRGPIVRADKGGEFDLVVRRWSWPGPGGKPVFNFRSDGREFSSGRCLIVADRFYEFTKPDDAKAKRKHKWRFTLRDAEQFAIAGLWRTDPSVGEAFTMLTTDPGEDIKPYHNRQIVVLPPGDFARWLDPAVPAAELCKPLPAGSLSVEQVC